MAGMFENGRQLKIRGTGAICRIESLLGAGGQGEVYLVDVAGVKRALKWYYPQTASVEQLETLDRLIQAGAPDERFLWPEDLLIDEGGTTFGYLMPLRPDRFMGITDLMKRNFTPSLQSLVTACVNVSDAFLNLHAKGWCYRDISQGNMFFDHRNGDILICDNDNVGVNESATTILGTPRFMAPEVVRGEAVPSTQTDLFSLAVMHFVMLMNHYPLDGRKEYEIHCFDRPAMERLYGSNPVFIFDPYDKSNEPVPGYQDNAIAFWAIYPAFLKALFTKSFTTGLRDPVNGRVRETDWRGQLSRLRDSIFYCTCGAENFFDLERLRQESGPMLCWSCRAPLHLPPRMRIGNTIVMLNPSSQLYPHHLGGSLDGVDFSKPFGEVTRHPTDPSRLGLKNLSTEVWTATVDGELLEIPPSRNVAVKNGTKIHFGKTDGEFRV